MPPTNQETPKRAGGGFGGAAILMTTAILASRILGMVREMAIAHQWGPSKVVDSFYAAMTIPDTFYFLISGGALSTTLIPILTGYFSKGKDEEAWRVFSIVTTLVATIIGVGIILCEIFIHPIMSRVFDDLPPDTLRMSIENSRIVLPQALMLMLGGLLMGVLYSRKKFVVPALGPVIYNIVIILGIVLLGPTMGAKGIAWGVLAGSFLGPVLIPAIAVWRMGGKFRPSYNARHPGVVKATLLMLPIIFGLSMPQLRNIITRWFAQALGTGWITLLTYGYMLMSAPVAIFGQAIGVAVYPTLSGDVVDNDMEAYRRNLSRGLRSILFITIPITVLMVLLREPLVQVLFERGQWSHADTTHCALLVALFCVGLIPQSGTAVVARGFYALQDTFTPVIAGTAAVGIFCGASFLLQRTYGAAGLALAAGLADVVNLGLLVVLLRRKVGRLDGGRIAVSLGKFSLAALAMAAGAYWGQIYLRQRFGAGFFGAFGESIIVAAGATFVYILIAYLLKAEELQFVHRMLLRKFTGRQSDQS